MNDLTTNSEDRLFNELKLHSLNSHIESHKVAGITLRPFSLQTREMLFGNPLVTGGDGMHLTHLVQFVFIHMRIKWIQKLPFAKAILTAIYYMVYAKIFIYGFEKAANEIVDIISLVNHEMIKVADNVNEDADIHKYDFSHKIELISFVMSNTNLTKEECENMYLGEFYQYYRASMRQSVGQNEYYKMVVTKYDEIRREENLKLQDKLNGIK